MSEELASLQVGDKVVLVGSYSRHTTYQIDTVSRTTKTRFQLSKSTIDYWNHKGYAVGGNKHYSTHIERYVPEVHDELLAGQERRRLISKHATRLEFFAIRVQRSRDQEQELFDLMEKVNTLILPYYTRYGGGA